MRESKRHGGVSVISPEASAETSAATHSQRRYDPGPVDRSKVVQKPVPRIQVDDPREFQVQQLRRRFAPKETIDDHGSLFAFRMAPSDPDFPFEMVGLDCVLHVPRGYPHDGKPSLDVQNTDMGRGYQINVERGFDRLLANQPQATLLALMTALDKQLESLLIEQKAETFKIISNANSSGKKQTVEIRKTSELKPASLPTQYDDVPKPQASYTPEQKRSAQARRDMETRQVEARLGRLPLYNKSSDGIAYTLPIEPRRRSDLPVSLHAIKAIKLFVPLLYPLQQCRIEIQGISRDAASNTEKAFEQKANDSSEATLMGHINYLSQNMHVLATETVEKKVIESSTVLNTITIQPNELDIERSNNKLLSPSTAEVDDRSHIKIIPRPPEWALGDEGKGRNDSDYSDSYDSGDEFSDESSGSELETTPEAPSTKPERGILLSFPYLELHGIELLELTSLCIIIKCERCKDTMDISNLHNNSTGDPSGLRAESCKKCASPLSIGRIDGFPINYSQAHSFPLSRISARTDACQLCASRILGS